MPTIYTGILARLIRKQILDKMCSIFTSVQKVLHQQQSSIFRTEEFYDQATVTKKIPEVVEDWKQMYTGKLEDELGPLGPFKHATVQDREYLPLFLRNKPKAKVFKIVEDPKVKKLLPVSKSLEVTLPSNGEKEEIRVKRVEENGKGGLRGNEVSAQTGYPKLRASGLSIVYDKSTRHATVMKTSDVEKLKLRRRNRPKKSIGKRNTSKKRNGHQNHAKRLCVKEFSVSELPVKSAEQNNIIKIDMRQLLNGVNGTQ